MPPRKPPTALETPPAVPSIRFLRYVGYLERSYRPGDIIPIAGVPSHILRGWLESGLAIEA